MQDPAQPPAIDGVRLSKHQANIQRLAKQFNLPVNQESLQSSLADPSPSLPDFKTSQTFTQPLFSSDLPADDFDSQKFKERLKKITLQFNKYSGTEESLGKENREENSQRVPAEKELNEESFRWQEKVKEIREKSKSRERKQKSRERSKKLYREDSDDEITYTDKPRVDLDQILNKYSKKEAKVVKEESDDLFSRASNSQSELEKSPRINNILKKYRVSKDSPEQQKLDSHNKSLEKLFEMSTHQNDQIRKSQENLASSIDDLISKIKLNYKILDSQSYPETEPSHEELKSKFQATATLMESNKSFGSVFKTQLQETLKHSPMQLLKAQKKSPTRQSLDKSHHSMRKSHESVEIEEVVKKFPKSIENKNLVYDQFVREDVIVDKNIKEEDEISKEVLETKEMEEEVDLERESSKAMEIGEVENKEEFPLETTFNQENQHYQEFQEAQEFLKVMNQVDQIQLEMESISKEEHQPVQKEPNLPAQQVQEEQKQKNDDTVSEIKNGKKDSSVIVEQRRIDPVVKERAQPKEQKPQSAATSHSTPSKQPKLPSKLSSQKKAKLELPKYDNFISWNEQQENKNEEFDLNYQQDLADIQDTLKTIKDLQLDGSPCKDLDSYLQEEIMKSRSLAIQEDPVRQSIMSFGGAGGEEGNQEIDYDLSSSDEEVQVLQEEAQIEIVPIQVKQAKKEVEVKLGKKEHLVQEKQPKNREEIKESDVSFQTTTEEDFQPKQFFDQKMHLPQQFYSLSSMLSNGFTQTQQLRQELKEKRNSMNFRDKELNDLIYVLPLAEIKLEQLQGQPKRDLLVQHLHKINYLLERHKFLAS